VRGDVDDFDLGLGEQLVETLEDAADDGEAFLDPVRRLRLDVVDADDVDAVGAVCRQVSELDDPAAADDPDTGPVARGEARPVVGE
jgi:hypothetical protein